MSDIVEYQPRTVEIIAQERATLVDFTKAVMQDGIDYGMIPGTKKNSLLKPGSEKLANLFGLQMLPPEELEAIEDWTGETHNNEPFFYYRYRVTLHRQGKEIASCVGSCNSWERKYRYRKGQKNTNIFDQVNTLQKMAQKRAYVGAVLVACSASEFFTQDMEDMYIDAEFDVVPGDLDKDAGSAVDLGKKLGATKVKERATPPKPTTSSHVNGTFDATRYWQHVKKNDINGTKILQKHTKGGNVDWKAACTEIGA